MSQNSNNNTEIKKAHAINIKCYKIIRKPIPFLKEWGWNDVKMEVLWEWHGEFERGLKWGRQWTVRNVWGKTENI